MPLPVADRGTLGSKLEDVEEESLTWPTAAVTASAVAPILEWSLETSIAAAASSASSESSTIAASEACRERR